MDDAQSREAALITFIVTASGLQVWGLSSAFWGIVIGFISFQVLKRSR
jgi:benzoate membrane transport protein